MAKFSWGLLAGCIITVVVGIIGDLLRRVTFLESGIYTNSYDGKDDVGEFEEG